MLLQLSGQSDGASDVVTLRRLVAAPQHHDQHRAALRCVEPIPGAEVLAQLRHPLADRLRVAPKPAGELTETRGQAELGGFVELVEPSVEGVGCLDIEQG